ncbi:MAG: hypothetical protein ACK5TK_15965 [Betaproteobacteria bacterium]
MPATRSDLRRRAVLAASLAAAALGVFYGYGFGDRLGGLALGLVTALNCAVLGAFAAGGLAERLLPNSGR